MLAVQQLDFINLVLQNMLGQPIRDYDELTEIETSALVEVGNIMISTFINAPDRPGRLDHHPDGARP